MLPSEKRWMLFHIIVGGHVLLRDKGSRRTAVHLYTSPNKKKEKRDGDRLLVMSSALPIVPHHRKAGEKKTNKARAVLGTRGQNNLLDLSVCTRAPRECCLTCISLENIQNKRIAFLLAALKAAEKRGRNLHLYYTCSKITFLVKSFTFKVYHIMWLVLKRYFQKM